MKLEIAKKLTLVRQHLEQLNHKFSRFSDPSIFKELDRMIAILDDDFMLQRSPYHLAKLAYSIALMRKKILQDLTLFPFSDHDDVRLIPLELQFTFGCKPVLGILAHINLKDKYEAFDEEHILLMIKKVISEIQLVKGSIYILQLSENTIKTVYFEIDKESGGSFNQEEVRKLRHLLKQEIPSCVEKLVPRIFMIRNEEEVLKNILTLSREIHRLSDIPQVMIHLDRQTTQEAIFTITLVQVCKWDQSKISEQFGKLKGHFSYFPERCQIVKYLRKQHPIEAQVFRIHLKKDPSLLRSDRSLHFYLARQKISRLLMDAIGEFRDYNGGIILRQREGLQVFMDLFPEMALKNPELLENFFYSISPIEMQATLPTECLKSLFQLFLEVMNEAVAKPSDYSLKFLQKDDQFCWMVRVPDSTFKETLDQILFHLNLSSKGLVKTYVNLQNTYFMGFAISGLENASCIQILTILTDALVSWQKKIESRRILKLGFAHSVVSLDPRIGGDQISSLILKLLTEGLMRENREGAIEYGIASSVEVSSDLKTYLFKLRQAQWSDGSWVTAYDFEYAWKTILSPNFETPFAYLFYPIKNAQRAKKGEVPPDVVGIQAVNEQILKVELHSPTPYFLELTAHTIYSPVHRLVDQLHPNWSSEAGSRYVCNGAFQLTKNSLHEGYELTKNLLYWDVDHIQLDQITILALNRYQALTMFQNDHTHWVGAPLFTGDAEFNYGEQDEPVEFLNKSVYWYVFNVSKPPFHHKKIRQALSLAIDRRQLAFMLNTKPAITPLPNGQSFFEHSSFTDFDPKIAQLLFNEALEEMGMTKEIFPMVTLVHLLGSTRSKLAAMIKQSWETVLQIRCTIKALEWQDLFQRLTRGDYQVGCISWQTWASDPMYTLNAFRDSKEPINFSKWEHERYQRLLDLAEQEVDLKKREQYYLKAEKILLEEMPVAPILESPSKAFKKKSLKVKISASSFINFKWAYFEPKSSFSGPSDTKKLESAQFLP